MALPKAAAKLLVRKFQEALDSGDISHNDLQRWLSDAVQEVGENGMWCCLIDFIGDGQSGDVIFSCGGDLKKAPYEITTVNSKVTAQIDDENIVDVLPHTTYEEEADEADHYASMESARLYTAGAVPLCERFVSKAARDAADSSSFAGKGKSFPILKSSDVMAAVRSMGRAGSDNYDAGTLKKNIVRISKAKGFTSSLPKAWQSGGDDKASEAAPSATSVSGELRLIEGAVAAEPIVLQEAARTDYEIKLIAPGKGSSAYYTPEVLKRDGPGVFPAHSKIFLNHATAAEEAARPEGKVEDLAGILTTAAAYSESHAKGPGLYARAKFFPDHAQTIEGKAAFIGMSIRGYGDVAKESGKPVMREGVPLLAKLTAARSVDVVTEAGAGGMILTEAARAAQNQQQTQESDMTAAEQTQLREALAEVKKLKERSAVQDAAGEVAAYFGTIQVGEGVRNRVSKRILEGTIPLTETGDLDRKKLREFAAAQVTDELAYLRELNPGIVRGMGANLPGAVQPTEAQTKEARKAEKKALKEANKRFASLVGFGGEMSKRGRRILSEGRSAFDPTYNAREHGALAQSGSILPMAGGE